MTDRTVVEGAEGVEGADEVEGDGRPAAPATAPRSRRPDGPETGRRRRRRRPTGKPPPLPRSIGATGKLGVVFVTVVLVWTVAAVNVEPVLRLAERIDTSLLRQIARLRTGWLTDIARGIDRLGSGWAVTIVAYGTVVALMVFRRWRHLLTWLGAMLVIRIVGATLYTNFSRPRPFGVTVIGRWSGFSMPSPPVGILAAVLMGMTYTLVVPGRPRTIAKVVIGIAIGLAAAARLYLAVDHPSDIFAGVALGVVIPLVAFRVFTPNDASPVAYKRGKTAHLDVGGRRGEAIREAIRDQLGIDVAEVKHVGLSGSGGSTPIRVRVAGDPPTYLFAKLYAMNHVRADRWYKLGRTILYGRLEDESTFQSVRRLVEYEDYTARLLRDVGIPTAVTYGIVELTPEREYLLVTEFLDGAEEIGDAQVDDDIIDQGLGIIRQLWDAGLAHRDIKPANLMVLDGQVRLIDVAFVQVRPSPWRQAVDLANMMLVLAVRTDPDRVYEHALRYFTEDDIAEAFAAARGVASPTQLRMAVKQDGRDLLTRFREKAPPRRPIPLQRWGFKRVGLALGLALGVLLAVGQVSDMLSPAHDVGITSSPDCGTDDTMVLMAQSVRSAASLPCIANRPAGWALRSVHISENGSRFSFDSDRAGPEAFEVILTGVRGCDTSGAVEVPSDQVGMRRYEQPERLAPGLRSTRFYVFEGGCVTYRFSFNDEGGPADLFAAEQAIDFQPRSTLVAEVRRAAGGRLCGRGVPCPGGTGE
jgi:membrane-associated phospholipid phosphatase/tRNA A-37 threonylcarbamoyl transferase component Bud32